MRNRDDEGQLVTADGDLGEGDEGNAAEAVSPAKRPDAPETPLVPDRRWGSRSSREPAADRSAGARRSWKVDPEETQRRPATPPARPAPSSVPPPPQPSKSGRAARGPGAPSVSADVAASPPPPPKPAPSAARSAPPAVPSSAAPERRAADRSGAAIGELAQQLAAMQAQMASLSAQLTTLAHRITYDMERGAQTTSERILRDLSQLPQQVSQQVGAHLGPAIDDLTDQIETDSARLTEVVDVRLAGRLTSIGEAVDAMPLGNVELLNGLETMGADLQDRFQRFATRIGDQVTAFERSTTTELSRLRDDMTELQASIGKPGEDHDLIDRMAGQVERLAERGSGSSEVVEAVEELITEHLELLRDGIEARVGALAPALHEELEALRAEALAGVGSGDAAFEERVDALEAALVERLDAALADQIDTLDGLVSDRHAMLLAAVTKANDEVLAAVGEIQPGGDPDHDPMAAVAEELQALRRRISLRFESGD